MSWRDLESLPEAVSHAAALLAKFDHCLMLGFGRLGPDQVQTLQSLAGVMAGSPLEKPVATAVEAIGRNEFLDRHFAALAAARAAIQGAMHDALHAQIAAVLGRPTVANPSPAAGTPVGPPLAVWQESARNWLMEIALAGFGQIDAQNLLPFTATLEQLQSEPKATRLAAVLTGFLNELLRSVPIADAEQATVYRWADLWTRSMLAALRSPEQPASTPVAGVFTPLAAHLEHHGFFVTAIIHGVLESGGKYRAVRVPLSAYKVDVVVGDELWRCFPTSTTSLLTALCKHLTVNIDGMPLLTTGDLLWTGKNKPGKAFDWLARAKDWLSPGATTVASWPGVDPGDRHPVQIAELVYLEDFKVHEGDDPALELAEGAKLPLAWQRHSPASELKPEDISKARCLLGLVRFDGGRFGVQPLGIGLGGKGGEKFTGSGIEQALGKKKNVTLDILRERASRLLRVKS